MSETVGRKFNGRRGDYEATCDYCGFAFLRSRLHVDGAGRLCCAKDAGLTATTLSRMNAEGAAQRPFMPHKDRGAPDIDPDVVTYITELP